MRAVGPRSCVAWFAQAGWWAGGRRVETHGAVGETEQPGAGVPAGGHVEPLAGRLAQRPGPGPGERAGAAAPGPGADGRWTACGRVRRHGGASPRRAPASAAARPA
ncbi:hypothetical protein ACE1SV_03550 [Streptomyces sennicomposti]